MMSVRPAPPAVTLLALAGAYFAAGKVGLSLAFVNESASAVWPPTGIALAAFLILGLRVWPAVFLGAFLVNLTTSGVATASLAIASGNTAEGLIGAWLVTRFARGRAAFERASDILRFAVLAGILATMVSATIGVLALLASRLANTSEAASIWITWWVGDAVGALLITPLVVLWSSRGGMASDAWRRAPEALGFATVLTIVSLIVFGNSPLGARNYPTAFLTVPVLLWAAFRFGACGTATATMGMAMIAIRGTLSGLGPFARSSPNESLLLLQAFLGVAFTGMLAVAAEVAARRARESEIGLLNESLRQSDRAKDQFLATLSHELRTPLNAALGWAHILKTGPIDDARRARALDAIYRNLLVQARIVSDIMDVSRIAIGGLRLEIGRVDLVAVVEAAVDTVRGSAAAKNVSIETRLPDVPSTLAGDAGRLQQVVWNLLANAVKFARVGGHVTLSVTRQPARFEIVVEDDGPGIRPDFLPQMFQQFRQADPSVTREHGGLGLGLAIVRHIVELHGGSVKAANRAGGGAVFTVSLPAREDDAPEPVTVLTPLRSSAPLHR